jgi:hypothetical protein
MKRTLIAAACAIFICGTACAREVTGGPTFILHGATAITARRVAQLNSTFSVVDGVFCVTEYIPTRDDRGWYVRKAVDCEE